MHCIKDELTTAEVLALSPEKQIEWHREKEASAALRSHLAAEVRKTDVVHLARRSVEHHRAAIRELEALLYR